MPDQFQRAEEQIEDLHAEGVLTDEERNEELRQLAREYQEAAEEAAAAAYHDELERW